MKKLCVATNCRQLMTQDGAPFYLIGDTAWELFHRLDREEAEYYLTTRKEQGYNLIQAVILAEFDGIRTPNAYGRIPFLQNDTGEYDLLLPDLSGEYSYFDHVEFILSKAEEIGLYMGVLPTWGDKYNCIWGEGPEVFTPENAFSYGQWLGDRYAHHTNIIWILGGDRPLSKKKHFDVIDGMARGLRESMSGDKLITFHPCGAHSSSQFVHDFDWLDFNMMQSGHGYPSPWCFDMMAADYAKKPTKPVMDGEPCYEDHPINFKPENGYFDDYNVRIAAYRNLLGGACGNTYGHHSIWGFKRPEEACAYFPNNWKIALHRPGARQIAIYRDFVEAHMPHNYTPVYDIVEENTHDANYVAAMVNEKEAILSVPTGLPISLNLNALPFIPRTMTTFDPKTGIYSEAMPMPGSMKIVIPGYPAGRNCDYILILKP